jgi:hypothetical protein
MSAMASALRNQGIHMEMSLDKTKGQLGTPPAGAMRNVTKSSPGGGPRGQLVFHLQHPLVHGHLLLLI